MDISSIGKSKQAGCPAHFVGRGVKKNLINHNTNLMESIHESEFDSHVPEVVFIFNLENNTWTWLLRNR